VITEFVSTAEGAYVLAVVLGVAVGLVAAMRGARSWLATVLITIVFVAAASTRISDAPFAGPLYAAPTGVTAILVVVVELRNSPLLAGESWWRKVLLVTVHGGAVRSAADLAERDPQAK
jgi:uncharacterized membrane protein